MPQMLVLELANNPGDALAIALAGAPTGYRTWLTAMGSGVRDDYVAIDSTGQSEWGIGYPTAGSPNTFTRETVLGGTMGPGTRVPFVGQVEIYSDIVTRNGRLSAASLPVIPTSRLLLTGATNVANNTLTYITHQSLVESSLAGAATVPTAGFTAPVSGSGRLVLNALMSAGAGGGVLRRALITRDGAIIAQAAAPPSSENHPFSLTWEGYVTAGQQFLAAVRQDSGGALQVTSSEFSLSVTGG